MNDAGPLPSAPSTPLRYDLTAALPVTAPAPVVRSPGLQRPQTVRGLRRVIRERLLLARAVERESPEQYGFTVGAATWLYVITSLFYRWYFRTQTFGLENLPRGRFLLIANHGSHALPWDGANILTACLLEADPPRLVHGMAEHRLMELPILRYAARRIGAVDGRRPECINLLRSGAAVLAFPEGTRAHVRRFSQRYRMARFGHGFVHVAIETGAPIVPVAVIGAEEEAPLLANPGWLKRLVRAPVAPLTPTLLMPLPVRYRLHFGTPLHVGGPRTDEHVAEEAARVRHELEALIERGLSTRPHVFF